MILRCIIISFTLITSILSSLLLTVVCRLLLSHKGSLVVSLVHPQIRVLHEIFLLLAVVVLGHRPKIKIFVLTVLPLLCSYVLFLVELGFLRAFGVSVSSSGHDHPLIFEFHDFCFEVFVFSLQLFFFVPVFVYFSVLLVDKFGHFVDLAFQFSIFGVDTNDYMFISCIG